MVVCPCRMPLALNLQWKNLWREGQGTVFDHLICFVQVISSSEGEERGSRRKMWKSRHIHFPTFGLFPTSLHVPQKEYNHGLQERGLQMFGNGNDERGVPQPLTRRRDTEQPLSDYRCFPVERRERKG